MTSRLSNSNALQSLCRGVNRVVSRERRALASSAYCFTQSDRHTQPAFCTNNEGGTGAYINGDMKIDNTIGSEQNHQNLTRITTPFFDLDFDLDEDDGG
jgi:hypothetical protein